MNKFTSLAMIVPLVGCASLEQVSAQSLPIPAAALAPTQVVFTPEQLDVLLGPIALYPDALIALILPASTNASDVVLASRYLRVGGDPNQAESQSWDESVQALARYPQIIQWMDENLAWTQQLGDAFAGQPADVMNAVQRLRARARAAGTLVDTPQQRIIYDGNSIEIVPAQPDVIYVPYYDPAIVYAPPPSYYGYGPSAFFNFSSGFAAGWWLSFGVDWRDRCVWNVRHEDRERFWQEHRHDWHRLVGPPRHDLRPSAPVIHTWRPRPEARNPRSYPPMRPMPVPPGSARPGQDHDRNNRPRDWHNDGQGHDRAPNSSTQPTPPAANPTPRTPWVGPVAAPPPRTALPKVAPLPQAPAGPRPHDDWRNNRGRDQSPSPNQPPSRPPVNNAAPQPSPGQPARAATPPFGRVGMPMPPVRNAPPPAPPPPRHAVAPPPPPAAQPPGQSQPPPGDDPRRNPNAREN